jgi:FtsP/CotA-like multicopper oxidase with cupredoxin domain
MAAEENAMAAPGPGLHVAPDVNPDPDVVEIHLVAQESVVRIAPGRSVRLWTYNGTLPGPLIEAEVGNTLVVHFRNRLPEPTTIHWHGVEVPAAMDGSNISQEAVPPGGYFRYEFRLLTASLFWYHPHIRSNEQTERGLAGPLIVRDPHEDRLLGLDRVRPYRGDRILVLDDLRLQEGRPDLLRPFATDAEAALEPIARALEQLNGRDGNMLLVNGTVTPAIRLRPGVPERWRIVNVSNARFMRISIPGHTLTRVGGDGGLLERPENVPPVSLIPDAGAPGHLRSDPDRDAGLLLVPGERADIVFTPSDRLGSAISVEWHDIPRGRHSVFVQPDGSLGVGDAEDDGKRAPVELLRLRLVGPAYELAWSPPASLRTIEPIDASGATPLPVPFGHSLPDAHGNVTFFNAMRMTTTPSGMAMTGVPFAELTPADAPDVEVGGTYVWEAVNMTGADHPFHVHGFFFQPIEVEYVDMDNPTSNRVVPFDRVENKDTILLPRRPGAKGRSRTILRAAVRFDDAGREGLVAAFGKTSSNDRSGGWLAHCHVLEHADRGMMTFYELRYPGTGGNG